MKAAKVIIELLKWGISWKFQGKKNSLAAMVTLICALWELEYNT
jgi:hypothetical protein